MGGISVGELIRRSVASHDPIEAELQAVLGKSVEELDRLNAVAAKSVDSALEQLVVLNTTLKKQNEICAQSTYHPIGAWSRKGD